jgi:hypothetical protein
VTLIIQPVAASTLEEVCSQCTTQYLRLLVTGSRDFHDATVVAYLMRRVSEAAGRPLHVTDGKAPGLDTLARRVTVVMKWPGQRFEAQWGAPCREECHHGKNAKTRSGRRYCPAAGGYRNQLMVDQGHHLCIGWMSRPHSAGTVDCLTRASRASIPALCVVRRDDQWVLDTFPPGTR